MVTADDLFDDLIAGEGDLVQLLLLLVAVSFLLRGLPVGRFSG